MLNHSRFVLAALAIAVVLAIGCGSAAEPGPAATQVRAPSAVVTAQATVTPAPNTKQPVTAAPVATLVDTPAQTAGGASQAAQEPVVTTALAAPEESPVASVGLPAVGTGAGDLSPGYALLLADGSTVTSEDLTPGREAGFPDVYRILVTGVSRRVTALQRHLPGIFPRSRLLCGGRRPLRGRGGAGEATAA